MFKIYFYILQFYYFFMLLYLKINIIYLTTIYREKTLRCTFWDQYVDLLLPLVDHPDPEPVVLIIQMCRAKMYNGKYLISSSRVILCKFITLFFIKNIKHPIMLIFVILFIR